MIKCAHCKQRHESVAQVRTCAYGDSTKPSDNLAARLATLAKPAPPRILSHQKVTEPGMYRIGDTIYLVMWNKAHTNLYARRLVKVMRGETIHKLTFEYDKGAIFRIDARDRLTLAEVEELGQTTGFCWVCTKKLTVQKSIKRGTGPVCAKRV